MIRLSTSASDHGFTFTLARDGALILTKGNRAEVADALRALDLDDPEPLIAAAEHWSFVEIRAEPSSHGPGA